MTATVLAATSIAYSAGPARSVWSGIYTEPQAERGAKVYATACAVCHAEDLTGEGFAPPLVNEPFSQRWKEGTVADLFTVLKFTMPQGNPGTLSDDEYTDLIAFLLSKNGVPVGNEGLKGDSAGMKELTFAKP